MAFRNLYENREGTEPINSMWVEDKRKLCIILDARDHWKDLASIRDLNLTQEEVLLLAQSVRAGESPTEGVLHHMNTLGMTTLQLYTSLKQCDLYKAMDIVKNYVPESYRCYATQSVPLDSDDHGASNPPGLEPLPPSNMTMQHVPSGTPLPLTPNTPHYTMEAPSFNSSMASLDTLSSTQVRVGKGMITTRNFHYADIVKATENFSDKYLIDGKGVQSSMYRVTLNHTTFAAKVFPPLAPSEFIASDLQDTRNHSHENIVPITGKSLDGDRFCIFYEYMQNYSLRYQLSRRGHLAMGNRVSILLDAARGLQYLHSNKPPLIHRNIKSSNILLDNSFRARVSDFGMAVHANRKSEDTTSVRSDYTHYSTQHDNSVIQKNRGYCAREVLNGAFHMKSDTYAFGVVIFEVCTGLSAYDSNRRDQELVDYVESRYKSREDAIAMADPSTRWVNEAYMTLFKLARSCTEDNKRCRPPMTEVYQQLHELSMEINNMVDEEEVMNQDYEESGHEYSNIGPDLTQYQNPPYFHPDSNPYCEAVPVMSHPVDPNRQRSEHDIQHYFNTGQREPVEASVQRMDSNTSSHISSLNLSLNESSPPQGTPIQLMQPSPIPSPNISENNQWSSGQLVNPKQRNADVSNIQSSKSWREHEQVEEQDHDILFSELRPSIDIFTTEGVQNPSPPSGMSSGPEAIPSGMSLGPAATPSGMSDIRLPTEPPALSDDDTDGDSSGDEEDNSEDETDTVVSSDTVVDVFSFLNSDSTTTTVEGDDLVQDEEGGGVDVDYVNELMKTLQVVTAADQAR